MQGVVDLSAVGRQLQYPRPGLKGLCEAFGWQLVKPKSVTLSNWERPLSPHQARARDNEEGGEDKCDGLPEGYPMR